MNGGPDKIKVETGMSVLPYTVVKIEGLSFARPGLVSSGTGFFYRLNTDEGPAMMIVTNKHVILGQDVLRFHMSLADINGKRVFGPAEIKEIDVSKCPIFHHPDPNVDLAMIWASGIILDIHNGGKSPYILALSEENFPPVWLAEKLSAFTNVVMIGFPNGLMDVVNNFPISRRGILSTPYYTDYNGTKNFVIDIAAFGGSSGSPVFAYFEGMSPTENGSAIGQSSVYLIGVLHSGPTLSAQGEVILEPVPTSSQITRTSLMMHLGFCAKVELLSDFKELVQELMRSDT